MNAESDTELVRPAKAGDLPAFEELVSRYERRWRNSRVPLLNHRFINGVVISQNTDGRLAKC